MQYTISQWLDHMKSARQDSVSWHSGSFRTDREQLAFEAGHNQGANDSRNNIATHGGFNLADPVVHGNI